MKQYKITGKDLPMLVLFAPDSEKALCQARAFFNKGYCSTQECVGKEKFSEDTILDKGFSPCIKCQHVSEHFSKETCFFDDDSFECDGRCLNCDYFGSIHCPDNQ